MRLSIFVLTLLFVNNFTNVTIMPEFIDKLALFKSAGYVKFDQNQNGTFVQHFSCPDYLVPLTCDPYRITHQLPPEL